MQREFELTAITLVDQHYAAGPDDMKRAIAEALEEAAAGAHKAGEGDPRQKLERELAELEKTSERGSE